MIWLALVGLAASDPPTLSLLVGDVEVQVEVADTPAERSTGLMHRMGLAPEAGMLFVYASQGPRSFWMKNTLIPLSIAFIDAEGRIVSLADMKPLDLSPVDSQVPATFALEMNQGWFESHELAVGAVVKGLPSPSKH